MPKRHRIVPLHPVSGEPIPEPRTYERIIWGIQFPSGNIKPINLGNPDDSNITTYFKTDHRSLSRLLDKGKASTFVAWESLTQRYLRDEHGRPILDEKGQPMREIRLGGQTRKRNQRGVLFDQGRRKQELDLGFQPIDKRNKVDVRNMRIVEPGKENIYQMNLRGDTIRDALSSLIVNVNKKKLIREGRHLLYSYVLRIIDPQGNVVDVITRSGNIDQYARGGGTMYELFGPANAEFLSIARDIAASGGFQLGGPDGMSIPAGQVTILANIHKELSSSIRKSLALTGYHFTDMAWLQAKAIQESPPSGKIEKDSPTFAMQHPVISKGRGRSKAVSAEDLEQVGRDTGYTVELTVRFEII